MLFQKSEANYMPCLKCGEKMFGIMNHKAREICEPCGGNVTDYHEDKPNPAKRAA
jgi:hypothetical protein